MLDLGNRILLNDGTSIVDDDKALRILLEKGELPEHIKVLGSDDADSYRYKYRKDITHILSDSDIAPDTSYDKGEYDAICDELHDTKRDVISDDVHQQRFNTELDYFERNGHQHLIIKLYHLIQRFREDGVVWGVGRGSACACYLFYLMGVHDVNPIEYELDFKEFSKEDLDDE